MSKTKQEMQDSIAKMELELAKMKEQVSKIEIEKKNEWSRVNVGECYYSISIDGEDGLFCVDKYRDFNDNFTSNFFEDCGNYNSNEKTMQQIAESFNLYLEMRRFAETEGKKIEAGSKDKCRYYIFYNENIERLDVNSVSYVIENLVAYFDSRELAQKAIEIYGERYLKTLGL